jgi:SAM-dependent methyltransferase
MGHLTPDLLDFVRTWLPEPPARVLEVGCGDGELTRLLAAEGWEATGIDPDPPDGEAFVAVTLEGFRADAPFDAAVAIRSLHHVGDLDRALANLASSLVPRAPLVLFEFAVEHADAVALDWLAARGLPPPVAEEHRAEVTELAALRAGLERRFDLLFAAPVPYLAREAGRPDLEAEENAAVAAGTLLPAGVRLAYAKRA